jgi:eukaryotic translation initiation factor 2C
LPDKDSFLHGAVKHAADIDHKIASKCFVADNSPNSEKKVSDASVLTNVLCSLNSKLGGENWIIPRKEFESTLEAKLEDVCVMGLDVAHGGVTDSGSVASGSSTEQSVVALLASVNVNFTKYATVIRHQKKRQELVQDIGGMAVEVLASYKKKNKKLPQRIIFYRDGVGEGMYNRVKQEEVAQLTKALADLYKKELLTPPSLIFIIVQKRISFRGFIKDAEGNIFNPYSGTMISKVVVDKDKPNFYLFSHNANQGVAKPTHYIVLANDTKMDVSKLGRFTYCLCFLHQGCSKAISTPAPVFYADKACGRVKEYYEGHPIVEEPVQDSFMI